MSIANLGMTILERARSASGCDRMRTLYIFANPLGNAIGDTVIASQHLPYLLGIPNNDVTVWTANGDVWHALYPGHAKMVSLMSTEEISSFDLIILDWVNAGPLFSAAVANTRAVILIWRNRNYLDVCSRGELLAEVPFPPIINHPQRISELYKFLGWEKAYCGPYASRLRSGIYYNPFASTPQKSINAKMASLIAKQLVESLPAEISICVGSRPVPFSSHDQKFFDVIEEGIKDQQTPTRQFRSGKLSIEQYVSTIGASSCVICPDTSTQHIAAITHTPCIVLYESRRAYNHYSFGWPDRDHYAVTMFESSESIESALTIIRFLVAHFCNVADYSTQIPINLKPAAAAFRTFLNKQLDALVFTDEVRQEAMHTLRILSESLPASWRPCLLPELRQVVNEISNNSVLERIDQISLRRRVSMISALRIIELLAF